MPLFSPYPKIILTHPVDDNDVLLEGLIKLGVDLMIDTMIHTSPISLSPKQIKSVIHSDVIIFTSKRGVQYTLSQINPVCCKEKQIVVIGKKTAQALETYELTPIIISQGQTSQEMGVDLVESGFLQGKKVTGLLAELADDTLYDYLSPICDYQRINVYHTFTSNKIQAETEETIKSKDKLIVVFTSASAAHAFIQLYGSILHENVKFISIGPSTSAMIEKNGYKTTLESNVSTYEGLLYSLTTLIKSNVISIYS